MDTTTGELVTTDAELDAIYGAPAPAATIKELAFVSDDYRQFIEASPFVLLSTAGPGGLDCSPRGDPAGFVRVVDERTLQLPDRRGNNRVDTLRNLVRDPRIGMLFLVPGIGETLRVNGTAVLRRDLPVRESFAMGDQRDKVPALVIEVTVDAVFTQCQKALVRSKLWDPATQIPRSALPTVGAMLQRITAGEFDGAAYDAAYPQRLRDTIY